MRSLFLSLLFAGLLATHAAAAPAPVVPTGPSPEAVKMIEARRAGLRAFELLDLQRLPPEQRNEMLQKMEPALKEFEAALESKDVHVFTEAVRDLVNGHYRAFPKSRILALLLPRLKTPERTIDRMVSQSFIMQHLARHHGTAASDALPDLLAMVTDVKVATYLRGQAVEAAALIGPGDEAVVKAFIAALDNPIPTTESGVHDRISARLGDMGKAAAPARPALVRQLARSEWFQDPAYMALGKLARDDSPRPLADYLDRLGKLDGIAVEQASAAFLHVVALGKKSDATRPREAIDPAVAKAARPVLLKIVEDRKDDVHSRAALRALVDLGPGGSPRAARLLAQLLLRTGSSPASEALQRLETTDPEAVAPLTEAFVKAAAGSSWYPPTLLAGTLARFGKEARPAVPAVVEALRRFRASANPGDAYADQFAAYLSVLSAAGGDAPGARQVVIDMLDPAGDVLKRSGPHATPTYQVHLLQTLSSLGLPAGGAERTLALKRVQEGLASDLAPVFSAAAAVVVSAKPLRQDEAGPLVPLLGRVLAADFRFKDAHARVVERWGWQFRSGEGALYGKGKALRALGSLGGQARAALPAVQAIAERPLEKRQSDYLPDPPINAIIHEARKTVESIR